MHSIVDLKPLVLSSSCIVVGLVPPKTSNAITCLIVYTCIPCTCTLLLYRGHFLTHLHSLFPYLSPHLSLSLSLTPSPLSYTFIVCTDTSNNTQGSTIAFFNEPVQIFIEMVSEPPPQQNTTIFLTDDSESERLNVTVHDPIRGDDDARLVWQYIIDVLDLPSKPTKGILRFTAIFQHNNMDCPSPDRIIYMIPVYRRSGK